MVDQAKVEAVKELQDKFSRAKLAIFADYRGLTVAEINELRHWLKAEKIEFRVIKNTLAKLAVEETPLSVGVSFFEGPTSVALSYEEEMGPAKILVDFAKEKKVFELKGAVLEGRAFDANGVRRMAELPPRDVLQAQLLSTFQGSAVQLVGVLQGVLQNFLGTLSSYAQTKS
jgi:large subunit ribosomal protein L10